MATMEKSSIARQLSAASLAINNTIADKELGTLVAAYGYNAAKMDEGRQLYLAAAEAVKKQTFASGAQRQATQHAREAEQRARASYQGLAQVARAVFIDHRAALAMLGLVGATPANPIEFINAANTLFDNVLKSAEISATLAGYGYDEKRLAHERAVISAFEHACEAKVAAMGAAQQATRDQQAALTTQTRWLAQYLKIAKVALRGKPQLYEKLSSAVRASRAPAQRPTAKKAALDPQEAA